jgi:hypothetical protein
MDKELMNSIYDNAVHMDSVYLEQAEHLYTMSLERIDGDGCYSKPDCVCCSLYI